MTVKISLPPKTNRSEYEKILLKKVHYGHCSVLERLLA